MITAAELLVRYRSDTSDLDRGAQKAGSSLDGMAAKATRAGRGLTIGVTAPLALAAKASVDAASDIGESTSKNEVLFGRAAEGVLSWSETTASSMGISKRAALEATGVFGNLITNMDIAKKPAADMSKGMVGLAADMASFNNADPSEVLNALRAGLTGETEPLKRFGVRLTAARIEAEALRMGLMKEGEELKDSARAQASYNLILGDTAAAQGDFARTADGAANKQRIMAARVDDLRAKIGAGLLPVWQALLGFGSKIIGMFEALGPTGQKVVLVIAGIAAAVGPLLIIGAKLVTSFNVIRTAMAGVNLAFMTNPFTILALAIVALVVIVVKNWDTIKRVLLAGLKAVVGFFSAAWDRLKAMTRAVWNGIKAALSAIWNGIKAAAKAIWDGILNYFKTVLGFYKNIFQKAWDAILGAVSTAWNAIREAVVNAVRRVYEFIKSIPGRIVDFLSDLPGLLFQLGKDAIQGLLNGLKSLVTGGNMAEITDGIVQNVKDQLKERSPSKVFEQIGRDAMLGFNQGFAGVRAPAIALPGGGGLSGGSLGPGGIISAGPASSGGGGRDLATAFSRALEDHERRRRSRRTGDLREKISVVMDSREVATAERTRKLLMGEIV